MILWMNETVAEKAYPMGCSDKPTSYYDYDNYPFPPKYTPIYNTEDYQITRRLGSGKFSDVFEAMDMRKSSRFVESADPVVLKCLKPVSDRKIRRELLVLSHCDRLPNLVRLLGVVVPENSTTTTTSTTKMPILVLQHAGVNSQWFCHGKGAVVGHHGKQRKDQHHDYLSSYEIRYYLYHLLVALDSLHAAGIMHRDVKPRNVLINRATSTSGVPPLLLIDLGLADMYLPHTKYNPRVASRAYKSPELLVGYAYYDYAMDLWGVGCILAGLLWRREPFFRGKNNADQLGKIVAVLGTQDLLAYMKKYQLEFTPELRQVLAQYVQRGEGRKQRMPWTEFASSEDLQEDACDLLDKLLVYDHAERWTAQQAMGHAFFDPVRERVHNELIRLFPNAAIPKIRRRTTET